MVRSLFSVYGLLTHLMKNLCLPANVVVRRTFSCIIPVQPSYNNAVYTERFLQKTEKKETSINKDILLCINKVHAFHFY